MSKGTRGGEKKKREKKREEPTQMVAGSNFSKGPNQSHFDWLSLLAWAADLIHSRPVNDILLLTIIVLPVPGYSYSLLKAS